MKNKNFFCGKGVITKIDAEHSTCSIVIVGGNSSNFFELKNVGLSHAGFSTLFGTGIFYIPKIGDHVIVMELNGEYWVQRSVPGYFETHDYQEADWENRKADFHPKKTSLREGELEGKATKGSKLYCNFSSGRRRMESGDAAVLTNEGESGLIARNEGDVEVFASALSARFYSYMENKITDTCEDYCFKNPSMYARYGSRSLGSNDIAWLPALSEEIYFTRERSYLFPYFAVYSGELYNIFFMRSEAVYHTADRETPKIKMRCDRELDCRRFFEKAPFVYEGQEAQKVSFIPPVNEEDTALYWRAISQDGSVFETTNANKMNTDENYTHVTRQTTYFDNKDFILKTKENIQALCGLEVNLLCEKIINMVAKEVFTLSGQKEMNIFSEEKIAMICKKIINIFSEEEMTIVSKKDMTIASEKKLNVTAGEEANIMSAKDMNIVSSQNTNIMAQKDVQINGSANVAVQAGKTASLKAGGVTLTLRGGKVVISSGGGFGGGFF